VIEFKYETSISLDRSVIRSTLVEVRDLLLRHEINGGDKNLNMDRVCGSNGCGTAACIGGWASILLLGFEGSSAQRYQQRQIVEHLFAALINADRAEGKRGDRLHKLFYTFSCTDDYNRPNVAATAIQRYLDGKTPWPKGKMPNVLRYKRKR
jgi:hypothetical protein